MESSNQAEQNSLKICPFLGITDDPASHYLYPRLDNHCYHAVPHQSVNIAYQQTFCLTSRYPKCIVYAQDLDGSLPEGINAEGEYLNWTERIRDYLNFPLLAIIIFILVLAITIALAIQQGVFITSAFIPRVTLTIAPTLAQTKQQPKLSATIYSSIIQLISTAPASLTSTAIPSPSEIITQTPTPSYTPGPDLQTPFGPQQGYLLYQVSAGENLYVITQKFQTSLEVIQAANTLIQGASIRPGDVLVIIPEQKNASGIQKFRIIHLELATQISQLAEQYQVSIDDLKYFNALGENSKTLDTIPAGYWLIIPVNSK
jgi:LysM repeat protein